MDARTPAPLLLHVGLHKTGTTWYQDKVFSREEAGFAVPWGRMASVAVTEFMLVDPFRFDAKAARDRIWPAGDEARGRGLVPVLSHEALSSRPHEGRYYAPTVADRLAASFPEARVVIGIREQAGLILSLFRQHVRNGGRESLTQFIGRGDEPPGWAPMCRLPFFEFDRFVGCYQERFGADRVLVIPIERLRSDGAGVLADLAAFAGVTPSAPLDPGGAANVGWGGRTLELFRFFNRFAVRNRLGPEQPFSVRTAQRVCYKVDALLPRSSHAGVEARWKRQIRERVGDRFAESNARLADMIGIDLAALGYPTGVSAS